MSTVIDPVTGTPIPADLGIIEQIPLGKQIVDWESLDATARPARSPIYPDDTFALMSNVQGQHPDTGSAQLVGTDGNHRLKVAATISGGGSVALTMNPDSYFASDLPSSGLTPGGTLIDFGSELSNYALIGVKASAVIDRAGTLVANTYAFINFAIAQSGPDDRWLITLPLTYNIGGGVGNTQAAALDTWLPPVPITPIGGDWSGWRLSANWDGTLPFRISFSVLFCEVA